MDFVTRVQSAIELLVKYNPRALRILTGEEDGPTVKEVVEMLRVASPKAEIEAIQTGKITCEAESMMILAEKYNHIIDRVGGWDHISAVVDLYKKACPDEWGVFVDNVIWVAGQRNMVEKVARKHQLSSVGFRSMARRVPRKIAKKAIQIPRKYTGGVQNDCGDGSQGN